MGKLRHGGEGALLGWVPTVPARGQQSVCRVRWARMLTVGLGPRILVCVSTWLSAARLPTRLSGQPCGQHRPPPRSSADWHLDPHGPRFPCTRSSHPSERKVGGGLKKSGREGTWRTPAGHLSRLLPESGSAFLPVAPLEKQCVPAGPRTGARFMGCLDSEMGAGSQDGQQCL